MSEMSENIDYKALYNSLKIENSKLLEKNIELNDIISRYRFRYGKPPRIITYAEMKKSREQREQKEQEEQKENKEIM